MEMVLNNRTLTAEEALQFGLVNRVAPVDSYLEMAIDLAAEIATGRRWQFAWGKRQ